METLTVLTTATPRLALHEKGYIPALEFLSQHFHLKVYINLDAIPTLGKNDWYDTLFGLKHLPYDVKLITRSLNPALPKPSFRRAAKTLFTECSPEADDQIFLWLEDDWQLTSDEDARQSLIDELKNFVASDNNFIITSIRDYPDGNPNFFKRKFFDEMRMFYAFCEPPLDPEVAMWQIQEKVFGVSKPRKNLVWLKSTFTDIGREWRRERNISKNNKRGKDLTTWVFEEKDK